MSVTPERMWRMMMAGSDELAAELGLEAPPDIFTPERALGPLDEWVAAEAPLRPDDAARLGFFLARLLIETHGGGVLLIRAHGHPLNEEWAVTGFVKGLAGDYHVPFLISAMRIGVDRSLTVREWYAQLGKEGR